MDYSSAVKKLLDKEKISIGDHISVEKDGRLIEGILMPNTGDPNIIIVKIGSGYNVGISIDKTKIKKLKKEKRHLPEKIKYEHDASKKNILILHTGGTVASKIDYETGAVNAAMNPEDLVASIPEIKNIANIRIETLFQMNSGDVEPEHWMEMAKKIGHEYERYDGIIVTHGTDTIHYTSAALSFMLKNITKPVILVGSQRSSDRGSSDAAMNMICAAYFIVNTGYAGVAVCMHASSNDDDCYIHSGLHVRKMHTSRRDSFRSIDVMPIAKVSVGGSVEMMGGFVKPVEPFKELPVFNKKIAIVMIRPGISHKELEFYEKNGYKGLIIEGTGLGHAPVNVLDEYTKEHAVILSTIKRMSKSMVIGMTSQCIYGKVNMNVYSYGRKLLEAGVLPVQMTPEAAYVKLGWILGHTKNMEAAKNLFQMNLIGEQVERIDPKAFLF